MPPTLTSCQSFSFDPFPKRRRGLLLSPLAGEDYSDGREINLDQFMLQTLCIYDSIGLSGYLSGAITDSSASGMNHGIL